MRFFAPSFAVVAAGTLAGTCAADETTRVSVSTSGDDSNGLSFRPAISSNGQFVAFTSNAGNLVADDTNGTYDVFVRDLATGTTSRVSVSSIGEQANNSSGASAISADGRIVAFASTASNLVPNDTNGWNDVFVHDRVTGETTRVSVSSAGIEGNASSHTPDISLDGRLVVFESAANNLVPGDTNSVWDIFIHDLETGTTSLVSMSATGGPSDADSRFASISADGRYVSFTSQGHNLVPGPTNFLTDVYVRDRMLGTTTRINVGPNGELGNDNSYASSISADGSVIAFSSHATNLVKNDATLSEDIFVYDSTTGELELITFAPGGAQADADSFWVNVSADGQFVGFVSNAENLVADDSNNVRDVFLYDRATGEITRISVSSDGVQGDDRSGWFSGPALSSNAQLVAFESYATNLVAQDQNNNLDIFLRGRSDGGATPGDLNRDGVVDEQDRAVLCSALGSSQGDKAFVAAADFSGDGVIDELDQQMFNDLLPPCAGDVVSSDTFQPPADGETNAADLAFLLGAWVSGPSCADFVGSKTFAPPPDGAVDGADLAFLLGAWGGCP